MRACDILIDEIEREITDKYIELPEGWTAEQASEVLDLWPRWDDGSPCMFGDEFTCYPKYDMEKKYEVFDRLTIYWKYHVWNRGEDKEKPHDGGFYEWNYMRPGGDGCEEYRPTKRKPRTVEDFLLEFYGEFAKAEYGDDSEVLSHYADELRVMIERDAEREWTCECVTEYVKSPTDGKTIMMHRCSACNELMRLDMNYCPHCGAKVANE